MRDVNQGCQNDVRLLLARCEFDNIVKLLEMSSLDHAVCFVQYQETDITDLASQGVVLCIKCKRVFWM